MPLVLVLVLVLLLVGNKIPPESKERITSAARAYNVQIHPTAKAGEARCSRSGGMQG